MVKRKKHDKDKYYNLARQQGYRARSAFKLIQLNKKYDFLSKAKVCIDLCAAPGGWCQVAAKYMPVSSIILGIDLLPIRPIPNVKTFVCDITTQRCRTIIKQELQTWSADIVLCDGAPNVGAQYSKDAYVQNELALIALKLGVDVLGRGGTFVTKVFRSQDYNALLWVFKQLFKKVSATKPLSSRNESAEIFVVCENYLAPQSIDPKLLDPKYVFSQVEAPDSGITVFHPKFGERKRHREGYNEALGVTLTNQQNVTAFMESTDPIRFLTDVTEIKVITEGDQDIMKHPKSTDEIKHCIKDLKVLGKSDFKRLLKWRSAILGYKSLVLKQKKVDEPIIVAEPVEKKSPEQLELEKEQSIREELAQVRINAAAKKKREKKKEREIKAKLRLRAAMGMEHDSIDVADQEGIFSLVSTGVKKSDVLENAALPEDDDASIDNGSDDDTDDEEARDYADILDKQLNSMYDQYINNRSADKATARQKKRTKVAKRDLAGAAVVREHEMYDGDGKKYASMLEIEKSSDEEDTDEEDALVVKAPKIVEHDNVVASRWFSGNELFNNLDGALQMPKTDKQIRKEKRKTAKDRRERRDEKQTKQDTLELVAEEKNAFAKTSGFGSTVGIQSEEISAEKKEMIRAGMGLALKEKASDGFEVVGQDDRKYDSDHEDYNIEDQAATLALGTMMLTHSKAKEIMDSSYNRFAWNDPADLPDWFLDDEDTNYRPQIPISKELMDQMREKFIEMASKPVKKVAEARMRKRKRLLNKMKVAKKKAADIANLPDMSNREKMKSIEQTMKGVKLKKQSKVYVVSTRGGRRSASGKAGSKGKVKLVDSRMKSDKRGEDNKKKRAKRKRK